MRVVEIQGWAMHYASLVGVVALLSTAAAGQQGRFVDLVVTTDDGDSVVEPGETATIALFVEMSPAPGGEVLGFAGATFDTIGGMNANTGSIVSFACLNALCNGGDATVTDGVNLFGTTVMQAAGQPGFSADNPIGVYKFTWQTSDFTPRTVRYSTATGIMQFWADDETIVPAGVIEADVAFCVGSCVDVAPDLPHGLEHEALGDATFDIDERGRLRVRGIGDTGKDGFRAAIGDAEHHRLKIEPSGIGAGGRLEFSAIAPGTADGVELLTTRIEGGESWTWFLDSEVDNEHTFEFSAFLEDDLVYSATCDQCSFDVDAFMKTPADVVCAVTPMIQVETGRIVSFEIQTPDTLSMFDGAEIIADRVEVRLKDFTPVAQTHTRVLATKITSLAITEESLGLFGAAFRSLDGAQLFAKGDCPSCSLTLGNIGDSGDDGIEYDFQPARILTTHVDFSEIELEPTRIVSFQLGALDGRVMTETLSIVFEYYHPAQVTLTPEFLGVGAPNSIVTAGLRSDGDLVQAVSGTINDPPKLQVDGLIGPETRAEFIPKVKIEVILGEDSEVFDADGKLLGVFDAIEYSVSPQAFEPDAIVGASVTGTKAPFSILDVTVTPLCTADCDGNGVLNILDFVCFQGLFVNNDGGADCDGNGVLNILDFVCFQGAFVAGCE